MTDRGWRCHCHCYEVTLIERLLLRLRDIETGGSARAGIRALAVRSTATAFLAALAAACEPTVVVGSRFCAAPPDAGPPDADGTGPVDLPWSTGFEPGFCDYAAPKGFCFGTGASTYTLVTSPVHSGLYAAAFTVQTDVDGGSQVRCVQQGTFPSAAYYGAWYYVPATAQNTGLWNLLHFQGGVPGQTLHGLWDVSLVSLSDGGLHTTFFDFLGGPTPEASAVPPIPIGQWFHIEVYFKRAMDSTGELSMWQDGVQAVHLTGIQTDDTNWGQWYVGNLATALVPPSSTVYVDDVTIGTGL
jgi:hypothetical protein